MAVSLLTIVLASASLSGGMGGAQTAYMHCLTTELEAAVMRRIEPASFAEGVPRVCESETALYRRMAVAAIIGQSTAGMSITAAEQRFADFDRANRAELIATFEERMRLRRGLARVAGQTVAMSGRQD